MKKTLQNRFAGGFDEFYEKYLPGLKKAGKDEFKALCPFHEDSDPSLFINKVNGLYHCHGCGNEGDYLTFYARRKKLGIRKDFQEILNAIASDFGLSQDRKKPKIVETYNYLNEAGAPLFQVCRMEPKGFMQRRANGKGGWIKKVTGVKRVLYRLPEVIKAREVLIVEGEKDADNLSKLGFTATTNPMGTGKWEAAYTETLKGKDVVLIPDNDDPGRDHMARVEKELQGVVKSLRRLDLQGLEDKGDVSDWIDACGDKDRATESLAIIIDGARPLREKEKDRVIFTAVELMSTELPEPRWAVPDILPEGCSILAGKPKMGKSILCLNLAVAVSTGGKAFGKIDVEQGGVLYLALEDTKNRLKRRLETILHGIPVPENLNFSIRWPRIIDGEIPGLDQAIKEMPDPRLVIIDTLEIIRPVQKGQQKTQYTVDYNDVITVKQLADKHGIAILIIHHLRKAASEDIMDDISGTFGLTGAADGILALQRITGRADALLHITGRDIESESYALKFHNDLLSWDLLGKADEVKATAARQLIYNTIKDVGIPIKPKELMEITDLPRSTMQDNLQKLVVDGSIEKISGFGTYTVKPQQ
ncbi:DNA primase [subsurface metagenome]